MSLRQCILWVLCDSPVTMSELTQKLFERGSYRQVKTQVETMIQSQELSLRSDNKICSLVSVDDMFNEKPMINPSSV